jgi:hypothetical protein
MSAFHIADSSRTSREVKALELQTFTAFQNVLRKVSDPPGGRSNLKPGAAAVRFIALGKRNKAGSNRCNKECLLVNVSDLY